MKVEKRDGRIVEFDQQRIANAIEKSMRETVTGVDEKLSKSIANKIKNEIEAKNEIVSVELIQDLVEEKLMASSRKDVAKAYILYRNNRNLTRDKSSSEYKLLDDEFISQYKHKPSNMQPLGEFVFYRTYSRYLPEEKRREYWWETVRRAVEYNCSIVPTTKQEAQKLFDNVFNLKQFLSGRTLWVGGTDVVKNNQMANFNCFSGDTEFLTSEGIKTFNDVINNDTVEVLNGNGAWSRAKVKSYGEQEIYNLTLRRKGTSIRKTIKTTANHLWFAEGKDKYHYLKTKTVDLVPQSVIRTKARFEHTTTNMCNIGIQHGIVYGDGTFDKKMGHCRISLIGKKQRFAKYFTTGKQCTEGKRDSILIYGLPHNWKTIPDTSYNHEYIKGFLYGLLLMDAKTGGTVALYQTGLENVKKLRSLFEYIGIPTSDVREQVRSNSNFGDYENQHGFTLLKEYIPKDWDGFYQEKTANTYWVVESVKNTGVFERVYCVEEPKTHSFTLTSGIHTHNCSAEAINEFNDFSELFYLLMLGTGVGVRILKSDVEKLPPIRKDYEIIHKDYAPVPKAERAENTSLIFDNQVVKIIVGDSKSGWTDSLKYYFNVIVEPQYKMVKTIVFNYDNVRPYGEKLKTFGGVASGHTALRDIFVKIDKVIKKTNSNKLRPIDCLDICNIIGEGVVVGGVRRTAEILLFDSDDEECINAKSNLYKKIEEQWIVDQDLVHRSMSNNSIFYQSKPTRERLHWQIEAMRYSGEPSFINQEAGLKRRENFNVCNPCAEILLDSKGMCNLTTINVMAFVNSDGTLDTTGLFEAQRLSARAGYRMTCIELELPKWNMVQQRDKLIGCSLTGWQDMVNATGISKEAQKLLLQELREVANDSAKEYAKALNQKAPLLCTCLKPEGSLSQLPVVSSGIHYSHSPYFIRRIRINSSDPIVKVCEELGYPIKLEVGQNINNCKTKVVEFPVKAPNGTTKYDISAIEQLENYKMFMENYVDHNASITVHVRNHEWDEVEQWVWDNWDDIVAVSFLSLDDSFYELMPYESITEEEYNIRKSNMRPFIPSLIQKYEVEETEFDLGQSECVGSVCPIR